MYLPTLKKINPQIEIPMSRVGCCYDNACAESFSNTLNKSFIFSLVLKRRKNYTTILKNLLINLIMIEFRKNQKLVL